MRKCQRAVHTVEVGVIARRVVNAEPLRGDLPALREARMPRGRSAREAMATGELFVVCSLLHLSYLRSRWWYGLPLENELLRKTPW
jgi:hypothetical protein